MALWSIAGVALPSDAGGREYAIGAALGWMIMLQDHIKVKA